MCPNGYQRLPQCPSGSQGFMNKSENREFEPYSLQEAGMHMKLFLDAFGQTWEAEIDKYLTLCKITYGKIEINPF